MAHDIIPPHLAIKAMRSSGYRDTAHAVAELIDNSIQAGFGIQKKTHVEVLCIDKNELVEERRRRHIDEIAVYDNAAGMSADDLRMALQFGNGSHLDETAQEGIGKFGMGLPGNSSISQCRRVDVWTWQNGKVLYTYLDIDDIEKGKQKEVPEPKAGKIPNSWLKLISQKLEDHGTLVVWTKLDRVNWKSSRAFLDNAEYLVGRMYRYFIEEGSASIRLASFEENGKTKVSEKYVRPNDPLYLMTGTSAPAPFNEKPAFDALGDADVILVPYRRKKHKVTIRYSVVKPEVRSLGGSSPIGRDAAGNQVCRLSVRGANWRLTALSTTRTDARERWWGVEVAFEPGLDDLFGVTNNKQAATFFMFREIDEDAKKEGVTTEEYKAALKDANHPRLPLYEISAKIHSRLRPSESRSSGWRSARARKPTGYQGETLPKTLATRVTLQRRAKVGDKGQSDKDESLPEEKRQKALQEELESEGLSEAEAKQRSIGYVKSKLKFLFQEAEVPGGAVFDVRSKSGVIIININTKHPAYEHLFELLREEEAEEANSPALKALKLLLTAWARMEDEAGDDRRQALEDTRSDWGRLARDFLKGVNG